SLKSSFVCGDEPASQDPVVKLKEAADTAKGKGIVVNSIFCGPAESTDASDWKEFAKLCGGGFINIDQQRGTLAIATPMDQRLGELSTKLNRTYVYYGVEGKEKHLNQVAQDLNAAAAGAPVAAARSVSKAGGLYRNDMWDLVDRMKQ